MESTQPILRCRYGYDPLDRLISQLQPDAPAHQRFYCKSRLATEIQGAMRYSIVQHGHQLLGLQRTGGDAPHTTLLVTDQQRSVLQTIETDQPPQPIAYSPYGHRPVESGLLSLLGFNGERPDPVTGHYLLGNGYRAFNPVLMRFNSPDSWSPFGKGGLNCYTYCLGNPINQIDLNGHNTLNPTFANRSISWLNHAKANLIKKPNSGKLPFAPQVPISDTRIIELSNEYLAIKDALSRVEPFQDNAIRNDYKNLKSPTLKTIAASAVYRHKLPTNELLPNLQSIANTPPVPPGAGDLLKKLNISTPGPMNTLNYYMSLQRHTPPHRLHYTDKITKAYYERIQHLIVNFRDKKINEYLQIEYELRGRQH